MSLDFQLPPKTPSGRQDRSDLVFTLCFIWILAGALGFAAQALAATPTGLRGAQVATPPSKGSVAKQKSKLKTVARASSSQAVNSSTSPQTWLSGGIWRSGPCASAQNFQVFSFTPSPKVEVGSGKVGEGESLELLRVAKLDGELIQVETRVCAPVGCNQTIERYKVLSPNQMQEWHFEGRLPERVPYVLVANGLAADGSGPGRIFNRCPA